MSSDHIDHQVKWTRQELTRCFNALSSEMRVFHIPGFNRRAKNTSFYTSMHHIKWMHGGEMEASARLTYSPQLQCFSLSMNRLNTTMWIFTSFAWHMANTGVGGIVMQIYHYFKSEIFSVHRTTHFASRIDCILHDVVSFFALYAAE